MLLAATVLANVPSLPPSAVFTHSPLTSLVRSDLGPECRATFSRDGQRLYLSGDSGLRSFPLDSRQPPKTLCFGFDRSEEQPACPGPLIGVVDEGLLFLASNDPERGRKLVILKPDQPQSRRELMLAAEPGGPLFGTDGRRLVWFATAELLVVYDLTTGKERARLGGPPGDPLESLVLGAGVVTAVGASGALWRRALARGPWRRLPRTPAELEPRRVVLSDDGTRAVEIGDGQLRLVGTARGAPGWTLDTPETPSVVAFSSDHRHLAILGGSVAVVIETADPARRPLPLEGLATAVKLDGNRVLAGFSSGAVKQWNLGSGERVDFSLPSTLGSVNELFVLANGALLTSHGEAADLQIVRWTAGGTRGAKAHFSPPPPVPFWASSHACAGMGMGVPGVCDAVWAGRFGGAARRGSSAR